MKEKIHYKKMSDLNVIQEIDPFYVDSIEVSTEDYYGLCVPMDANFIVFKDGKIFENSIKTPEKLKNIKVWVQSDEEEKENIIESLFSTSQNPNPSKLAKSRNSRSASYLMSKILKYSDFCGGDMRTLLLEDDFYIVEKTPTSIKISHSEPLVED